ncbi:unnamed protein product [Brugia timori]|uniref:Uncharacterized protein n=1 Tax=Brugia timori TaxID=42155 RepID=A0A0R3QL12_9BILA|nr:unnamed protein product [Brugia timori]
MIKEVIANWVDFSFFMWPELKNKSNVLSLPSLIGEENYSFPWTSTDSDYSLDCEVDSALLLSDCERPWKQHMRRKYFLPQTEGYIDFIIM